LQLLLNLVIVSYYYCLNSFKSLQGSFYAATTTTTSTVTYSTKAACFSSINTVFFPGLLYINNTMTRTASFPQYQMANSIVSLSCNGYQTYSLMGTNAVVYLGINDNTNKPACWPVTSTNALTFKRKLTAQGCYQIFFQLQQNTATCYSGNYPLSGSTIIGAIWVTNSTSAQPSLAPTSPSLRPSAAPTASPITVRPSTTPLRGPTIFPTTSPV